ncbi:MAG: hypothetical protein ACJAWC_002700 [Yoonia sp.]|jgi:hypothetical protein
MFSDFISNPLVVDICFNKGAYLADGLVVNLCGQANALFTQPDQKLK